MIRTAIVQTPVAREVSDTRRPDRPTLQQLAAQGGSRKRFLPEDGDKTVSVSAFNSSI